MSARRIALATAVPALCVGGVAAAILTRGDGHDFEKRRVELTALPPIARAEVRAHGGGRCTEEQPTVFLCVLVTPKQAHEGRSGREWCFDGDGPRTLSMYPARATDHGWSCRAS